MAPSFPLSSPKVGRHIVILGLLLGACERPADGWTDGPVDSLVNGWSFWVELATPRAGRIDCVDPTDVDERHSMFLPAATVHAATVVGLLADTTYVCTLVAGDREQVVTIRTAPLPPWLPTWTVQVTDRSDDGYTLLNHGTDWLEDRQPKLMIVDRDGRLRWYLDVPFQAADLDAQYQGDGAVLYGGGIRVVPTIVDLTGEVWLRAPPSSTGKGYHHHVERIETGEIATLAFAGNVGAGRSWNGFVVDVLDPGMSVQTFSFDSQRGVDAGWLPVAAEGEKDPYHANALQFEGDDLFLNLRALSWLVKMDRQTQEVAWILGPGQDFRLVTEMGTADLPSNWFYRPHAPEKHGNRILFYDNGQGRPGLDYSRIVELTLNEDARTAMVTWTYTEPGWYEPIWGDVDRLPNGDVLFVRAHCHKCVPTKTSQRTEIVQVTWDKEVVWRMTFDGAHDAGYRAERIDACAIFANTKYCRP